MRSPLPPRRRSSFDRGPRVSDEDVLDQLRRSLEALHRANRALERVKKILSEPSRV